MKNSLQVGLIAGLLLVGCSDGNEHANTEKSVDNSILSTQLKAIEKARGVEQILQDGMQKRDQMMNEQDR